MFNIYVMVLLSSIQFINVMNKSDKYYNEMNVILKNNIKCASTGIY